MHLWCIRRKPHKARRDCFAPLPPVRYMGFNPYPVRYMGFKHLVTFSLRIAHPIPLIMSAARELQIQYQRGYDTGLTDGYYKGYYAKHADSYEDGHQHGYREGYLSGTLTGLFIGTFAAMTGSILMYVFTNK